MLQRHVLNGIRVVDFSWIWAGPLVTKILGEHGAEVIKIEGAARPDLVRMLTPFKDGVPGMNRSGLFANYNANKYSITIDLRDPRGVEVVKKLVARADIVLENFGPGAMERRGLGYDELIKVKPDIIMLSLTGFGQYGPYSKQPTMGQVLQAASGWVHLLGWADRTPSLPAAAYTDFVGSWFALMALMAALDYKRRTGKGQYIDLSMHEAAVHFAATIEMDYAINGRIQNRTGNRNPGAVPHGVYPCKGHDRWCAIAVFTDEEWQALCQTMGNPVWTKSAKFDTFLHRTENVGELDELIAGWTIEFTPEELMEKLQAVGVATGVVQTGEDLVDHDLQLRHRQHYVVLDHPEIGDHISESPPFRLSKTPSKPQRPAPCFGEHTEYVCRQILGMSDWEFAELVASGVLS
jgi:crotonobetainyl-CoA:carnitine CoA-transferase CaiB-like acyl-CoA transferase